MALQQSFTSIQYGFTASEAYKHVTRIDMSKNGSGICFVSTFYDASARWDDKNPLIENSYAFQSGDVTFTGDVVADIYTYLKTLPEFADAIDV